MSPKLTVATTFPIHPAHGGGQARVLGLYGAVAELGVEVDVVTLGSCGERAATIALRPGLREIRVPQSAAHEAAAVRMQGQFDGIPLTDVALALHHRLTPGYARAIRASAADAAAVVACHPYATRVLLDAAPAIPLIYEAQDVETDLKAQVLGDGALLDVVREHETLACREAAQILTCCDDDAERLRQLFGVPAERLLTVANGYDADRVRHTPWARRAALRRSVGLERFTALFVGSWHGPNIEAGRAVVAALERLPSIDALIVGSAGLALGDRPIPPNVDVTGAVDAAFLDAVLALADVAVNPMASGSGTNLKMLQYAAAGIPLISSAFGARGLGLVAGEHYVRAEPAQLAEALEAVAGEPEAALRRRAGRAYEHVRGAFDWREIARRWLSRSTVGDLLVRA